MLAMLYIPTENESLLLHPLISPFGNCTFYLIANIKQNTHTKCQNILIIYHLRDVGVWVNSDKWERSKKLQRYQKRGREMVQRWKYWAVILFLALPQTRGLTFSKQVCHQLCQELNQTSNVSALPPHKKNDPSLGNSCDDELWGV